MAGKSKAPVKFPNVNQVARMKEDSIYAVGERKADPFAKGKIRHRGGKQTITQSGGWIHSKATGKLRHERVQVCSDKAPDQLLCMITDNEVLTKTGKPKKVVVDLNNRHTYPLNKIKIVTEEIIAGEREGQTVQRMLLDGETNKASESYLEDVNTCAKIHTKRKRTKKPRKALGRR